MLSIYVLVTKAAIWKVKGNYRLRVGCVYNKYLFMLGDRIELVTKTSID